MCSLEGVGSALSSLLISQTAPDLGPNSAGHLSMSFALNTQDGETGVSLGSNS